VPDALRAAGVEIRVHAVSSSNQGRCLARRSRSSRLGSDHAGRSHSVLTSSRNRRSSQRNCGSSISLPRDDDHRCQRPRGSHSRVRDGADRPASKRASGNSSNDCATRKARA
jgi:hypothetical protein